MHLATHLYTHLMDIKNTLTGRKTLGDKTYMVKEKRKSSNDKGKEKKIEKVRNK